MNKEHVSSTIMKLHDDAMNRFSVLRFTQDELFELIQDGVDEISMLIDDNYVLVSSIKIYNEKLVVSMVHKYTSFDDLIDDPNITMDFDGEIKKTVIVQKSTKAGIVEFVHITYAKLPDDYKQLLIDLGLYKVDVIESVSVLCKRG